jgi:hypothetical protein
MYRSILPSTVLDFVPANWTNRTEVDLIDSEREIGRHSRCSDRSQAMSPLNGVKMNKWVSSGIVSLMAGTISMSASAATAAPGNEQAQLDEITRATINAVLLDASDLIAAKLKDRRIDGAAVQADIDQILIDASDLIASKLKDRRVDF